MTDIRLLYIIKDRNQCSTFVIANHPDEALFYALASSYIKKPYTIIDASIYNYDFIEMITDKYPNPNHVGPLTYSRFNEWHIGHN